VDELTPVMEYRIPGANAKMPFELVVYEDRLVCITSWTFKTKTDTYLFKDIKRVNIQKNESGWPKYLSIFLRDGKHVTFDLGYSKAGIEIQEYIEANIF